MRRRVALLFGLVALAALWLGPLPELASSSFAAHMGMHVGVVAVAAPALALGLAGGRFDPVVRAPALFPPVPWSVVELLVVWAWHTPALHHAARHAAPWFAVEQASFLGSGLVVWLSAFGGGARLRAERTGAGVLALLLTSMHMTLLGALLALAPRPLFGHATGGALPCKSSEGICRGDQPVMVGLTPLDDQHLGGAIMLLVGGIAYLAGGLWLSLRLIRGAA